MKKPKKFSGRGEGRGASLFLFRLLLIVCSCYCRRLNGSLSVDGFGGFRLTQIFQRREPKSPASASSIKMTNPNLLEGDADAYNAIFSSSVELSSSYVRNGALTVTRSVRDIDRNLRRSFVYHIPLVASSFGKEESQQDSDRLTMPPYELPSSIKYVLPSPSGKKIAKLIEEDIPCSTDNNSNRKRQIIEIWTHGGMHLTKRCILPDNIHGKVYTEKSKFGGMSWRQNSEDALVYVAERISPTTRSFFDRSSDQTSNLSTICADSSSSVIPAGTQFTLGFGIKEDWGEKYNDVSHPEIFVLSTETGNVASITNVPGGTQQEKQQTNHTTMLFAFGQPIFSPCGNCVIYTAWNVGPRRLGATYCFQRPAEIYSSKVETLLAYLSNGSHINKSPQQDPCYICLTPNDRLARSPRVMEGTNKIVFLCNTEGFDSHNGCMGLDVIEWDMTNSRPLLETKRTVVKPVFTPNRDVTSTVESPFGLAFPGLFLDYLPEECSSADGKYLYCDSQWGSTTRVVRISLQDGSVEPILGANESSASAHYHGGSHYFLGTFKDSILVFQNSPVHPGNILSVPPSGEAIQQTFTMYPIAVTAFSPVTYPFSSEDVQWKIVHAYAPDGDPNNIIQSILLMPKHVGETKPPLIVVPHGGPHSCSSTTFMPSYLFLCMRGKYAILLVNFRGSTGFGQGSIETLLGKISDCDVQDLFLATKSVLTKGEVDESRVGICGGSHGGFLAGHMISKYSDMFKVAAMRNPVTNVAALVTGSDIPDWGYVESLGSGTYDWTTFRPPLKNEIDSMYNVSPIANIQNVKAPTLIALGMKDRRVPPSQGLEYYYALRSKGLSTKLLVYKDDDHAIDSPVSEADHWINIKQWFDNHL